jgi:hypothetical protein
MIGYCEEGDQQISIYEYMPGGTWTQLHDKGFHALDWKTRLQIALHIAQGLQYFGIQHPLLWRDNIFFTKNWVPKSILIQTQYPNITWGSISIFGGILRDLISRQPRPEYEKGLNHLVKIVLEDSINMGITNSTLGSNFRTEAIMKVVKLTHTCLNYEPLTMSDMIDEINGALQLEEGQKVEGVIKIEIPQYASQ